MSFDESPQTLEVCDEFFVVVLALYVESVPDVSAEDYSSKSFVVCPSDAVSVHSAESIHVFVYQSVSCSLVYFNCRERCFFVWEMQAVEYVVQEDISALSFQFFQHRNVVAASAHFSSVSLGHFLRREVEMYSSQVELLFHVVVFVNDYLAVIVFRYECQEALEVYRF